ncbi:MAG: hypothetical protein N2645_12055 [Clostridia bacterium]|nr:hypothetical protein [Clostridia bacterium]
MVFHGNVTDYDASTRSYLINFRASSESINDFGGYAEIFLRYGKTKYRFFNHRSDSLDHKTMQLLKANLLKTIYHFNEDRITRIEEYRIKK